VENLVDNFGPPRDRFLVAKRCRKRDFGSRKFCGTSRRGSPDRRSRWGRCGLSSACVGLRAAPATSLRAGPGKGAESSQPTVPSRAAGEGEDRKGAGGFPQVGDKLWRTSCPGRGNPWTEGTSGAADRGPLRGGSGEAALGPGWCPRKRPIRAGGRLREQVFPARRPRVSGSPGGRGGHRESGLARWARSRTGDPVLPARAPAPGVVGSPAGGATSSRHEVSEPIGLGRSSRREESRREVPGGESRPAPGP
jgi:hypothetical protein